MCRPAAIPQMCNNVPAAQITGRGGQCAVRPPLPPRVRPGARPSSRCPCRRRAPRGPQQDGPRVRSFPDQLDDGARRRGHRDLLRWAQARQRFIPDRQRPTRRGERQQVRGMRVDHRAGPRPDPVHLGVHGHDLSAHPARVAHGHRSIEADHGQVIGHEVAGPVRRGDQHGVRPDPGREVSVPGMRQHPARTRLIATSTTARRSARCDHSAASATGACPGVVICASLGHERKTTRMTDVPQPAAEKTGQPSGKEQP